MKNDTLRTSIRDLLDAARARPEQRETLLRDPAAVLAAAGIAPNDEDVTGYAPHDDCWLFITCTLGTWFTCTLSTI